MKVYDLSMFFNENDLYELRLNQHWDFVDNFIVVESKEAHTGYRKPLNFDHDRFKKYKEKLIYISYDNTADELKKYPFLLDDYSRRDRSIEGKNNDDWIRSDFHGNYSVKVLQDLGAKDDDIILNNSLDEIIEKESFNKALVIFNQDKEKTYPLKMFGERFVSDKNGHQIFTRPTFGFKLNMYVYKFNLWSQYQDVGQITEYSYFKNLLPTTSRCLSMHTHDCIGPNAGWHFSFMDDTDGEKVLEKQKSWGHSRDAISGQETKFNHTSKKQALDRMFQDYKLTKKKISYNTHPKYLLDNMDKYKNYIFEREFESTHGL
mgnify:CR=1 FL=1|jgi:beta-1,4-mannosyl-glycoprotein beta-1,4-N-acetylglucosaminyltransferase